MPYTFTNEDLYRKLYATRFINLEDLEDFILGALRTDYSVVDARRDLHTRLSNLVENAPKLRVMLQGDARFPNDPEDVYLSTGDEALTRTLMALANNLSFRATNVAKDIDTARNRAEAQVQVVNEQGSQDNVKRFEELLKTLKGVSNDSSLYWQRVSFERKLGAVWAHP